MPTSSTAKELLDLEREYWGAIRRKDPKSAVALTDKRLWW